MVSEDAADFALEFDGAASELGAKFARERSQTFVSDFKTDFCDAALRSQHLAGSVHAQASQKIMRSFAKRVTEQSMEMKFRQTSLARRLLEQYAGLIFRCEQIASATEAAKSVVVEKLGHFAEMIPPLLSFLKARTAASV